VRVTAPSFLSLNLALQQPSSISMMDGPIAGSSVSDSSLTRVSEPTLRAVATLPSSMEASSNSDPTGGAMMAGGLVATVPPLFPPDKNCLSQCVSSR